MTPDWGATMIDDLATLRAELERWQETFAEGFFLASNPEDARQFADALLTNLPAILAALARAESAERERDDALAEAASLHGAECSENAALRARAEALAEACRIFRTYGLRPHDVSGAAEWNRALELSVS